MRENYAALHEKAFRKFISGTLYIIIASYLAGALLFYLSFPINYFFLIGAVLNVVPVIAIHTTPMVYIKRSIKIYMIVIAIPLYSITVLCLLKGVVTPIFWYIATSVFIYAAFPFGKTIRWSVGCLCLMLSAFIMALILRYTIYDNAPIDLPALSLYQILLTEITNSFFVLLMICYCLYYIHFFHQLQIDELLNSVNETGGNGKISLVSEGDDDKYKKIYARIIEYIEIRQPYLNPEFKITQMVNDLNINATYLTKAIRVNKNTNFSNLVNYYRIERVKELMQTNTSRYTLEYIYMSSGFKSQSAFNRAFKQQINITPSEYYKGILSTHDESH
jgi:AraC-like DNA-binding protein